MTHLHKSWKKEECIILILAIQMGLGYTWDISNAENAALHSSFLASVSSKISDKSKVTDYFELVELCVSEINGGNTDLAIKLFLIINDIDLLNTLSLIINGNDILTSVIINAYANSTENVQNVLNFIGRLPSFVQRGNGYKAILREMTINNHVSSSEIITLAYWIKQTMDIFNFQGVLTTDLVESRSLFENLKNQLPALVKSLFWDRVCIKSNYRNEYMYSYCECSSNILNRNLFTWIPRTQVGAQGFWRFEPVDGGKCFEIINMHYNEYLFSSTDMYDANRRRVYTAKYNNSAAPSQWKVEIYDLEKNFITLTDNNRNEPLYSPDHMYDSQRRHVFSWLPAIVEPAKNIWEIVPC